MGVAVVELDDGCRWRRLGLRPALVVLAVALAAVVGALVGSSSARAADCAKADFAYNGACGPEYESPAWGDGDGWRAPSQYSTIQLAQITGNGQDELLGRNADGLEVWRFDTSIGQWRPAIGADGHPEVLSDFRSPGPSESPDSGGANPQVYSTIQAAHVLSSNSESIVSSFPDGTRTYDYQPPTGSQSIEGGTWLREPISGPSGNLPPSQYLNLRVIGVQPNTASATIVTQNLYWSYTGNGTPGQAGWALGNQPSSSNPAATWNPGSTKPAQYLNSLAAEWPVAGPGGQHLVPANVYRTQYGVQFQTYDPPGNVCAYYVDKYGNHCYDGGGPPAYWGGDSEDRNAMGPFPSMSNAGPYGCAEENFSCFDDSPSWYETMQVANNLRGAADKDGYVLGRLYDGLHVYAYDGSKWDTSLPVLSALQDPATGTLPAGTWSSIRTGDVTGDGSTDVVAVVDGQLKAWQLKPNGSGGWAWSELPAAVPVNLGHSFEQNASYYSTLQVGPVAGPGYPDGVIARGPYGIRTWFYCSGASSPVPGCASLHGQSGWTSFQAQDPTSYPQFTGAQANAWTALNSLARSRGLIGQNAATIRDMWTSEIPPTDGQLTQLRDGLVLAAGCSGQTSANPPTYQTCTPPAASTGFAAADWTAVVNGTLKEIYDARQVLAYFKQLDGIRSDAFLSNDAALPAIGSELQPLNGAAATPVSISPWAAGSAGLGLAGAVVGVLNPVAGVALAAASYGLGVISSGTPALQAPPFFGTYADLQSKYATAVSQAIAALKTQTTEVLQNYGDTQLVTQLTAPGGPWSRLDSAGLVGSMQEGLSLWAYQTLLPTLYDRYAITGCQGERESPGNTDCNFTAWGPVTETNGSFTTLGQPPQGNWDSGAIGGGGTPCYWHWFVQFIRCDYNTPPTSNGADGDKLATQIWGPVSDTCNYTGDPLTAWKFGCNLGVQAQYSIGQAGDAYGWDFTTCTGNPVVSANGGGRGNGPPLQGQCSPPTGTANPGDDGAVQLAATAGAPPGFKVTTATFSAKGLLAPTHKHGKTDATGSTKTPTTIHLSLSHGKELPGGGAELGTPSGAPPATLTLRRDHGQPRLQFSVSRVPVSLPEACQTLPASTSLATPSFAVTTSLTLSNGHRTRSIRMPAAWRCERNQAGTITAIHTVKPTPPAQRPGLQISAHAPHGVYPGSTVQYTVRLHNARRGHRRPTITSLWNVNTTVNVIPARTQRHKGHSHFSYRSVPVVRRIRELRRGHSRLLRIAVRIPTAFHHSGVHRVCINAQATADAARAAFAKSCPQIVGPPSGRG